ncbi:hypothetical protein GUJ93_ZPchr0001g31463 [Zizania palustris]|uniref:FLZ-type domain-containing protein n=1 Tax=Zizania palustris TaxID=103762 RepID=A0A8J5R7I8_ZIZPA|nr:hypothetical protein GUJ93_ZPchr0001g31463 [Zizania palustris]
MLRRMVSDPTPDSAVGGEAGRSRGGGGVMFAVPRLFVGLAAKRGTDGGESSRSPTSPLDPKALLLRSPRSPRTWDSEPVGLGLVDVLAGDAKNCLLSPRVGLKPHTSLPKDCGGGGGGGHSGPELGKTMSCPATDTAATVGTSVPCSIFFHGDLKSGPEATRLDGAHSNAKRRSFDLGSKIPGPGSLPASIAAGTRRFIASSQTVHAAADVAMEVTEAPAESYWVVKCAAGDDFLSSCFTCKKKLEGNDIYIYRGEKAFCSSICREQEILIEEEAENKTTTTISSPRSSCSSIHEEIFMAGMTVAT